MAYKRKFYHIKVETYSFTPLYYIYLILDPDSNEIKYVGRTMDFTNRTIAHLSVRKPMSPIQRYINSLQLAGKKPVFELMDFSNCSDSAWLEAFWIWQLRSWGFTLLNAQTPDIHAPTSKTNDLRYCDTIKMIS